MLEENMRINIIWLFLVFAAHSAFADNYYRWVDKNGMVNYSDQSPDKAVNNLVQKKAEINVIDGQSSYVLKVAASKHPVILFAGDCGPLCINAKALLDKRGIPYTLKDPQKNKADADALNTLTGAMRLPVLEVGSTPVKGFESNAWNAALDQAGYPKSPLPGDVKAAPASLAK